mmetsp:Transcript_16445/g.49711  ORF Transcript_16445/g.49711 Transcript_16445/m.49711 type:complete len:208 (-) Transcript_16445:2035-2658(-)
MPSKSGGRKSGLSPMDVGEAASSSRLTASSARSPTTATPPSAGVSSLVARPKFASVLTTSAVSSRPRTQSSDEIEMLRRSRLASSSLLSRLKLREPRCWWGCAVDAANVTCCASSYLLRLRWCARDTRCGGGIVNPSSVVGSGDDAAVGTGGCCCRCCCCWSKLCCCCCSSWVSCCCCDCGGVGCSERFSSGVAAADAAVSVVACCC